MTSILTHTILQALLMLATSDMCPEADWYPEDLRATGRYVVVQQCSVPLTQDMSELDARAFYRAARKLARQ